MINSSPLPSSMARSQPMPSSSAPVAPNVPIASSVGGNVHIKAEPGTSYDLHSLPPANGLYGNQAALQRAGQHLQEKFGDSASTQVNQLQQRAALASQGIPQSRPQPGQAGPPLSEDQRKALHDQQRRMYLQQQAQQQRQQQQYQGLHQAQQRATVNNNQTDGSADWDVMVGQRRADALNGEAGRTDADMTIRQQVEKMSHEMEGGGLMMTLSERAKQPVHKKRKATSGFVASSSGNGLATGQVAAQIPRVPQLDGPDDTDEDDKTGIKSDIEEDEDAINSDLDDPDDNVVDENEDDAQQGQIMLCTYDKVQRVKNKWKTTLKDGVLTTGGKE